jgi:hypothetical protein
MRRILTGMRMLLPGMLHAAAPVPGEVVPERIAGAMPRNVVYILSDDNRHDAMGFLGHPFAATPAMDSMAANGAHVKNAVDLPHQHQVVGRLPEWLFVPTASRSADQLALPGYAKVLVAWVVALPLDLRRLRQELLLPGRHLARVDPERTRQLGRIKAPENRGPPHPRGLTAFG